MHRTAEGLHDPIHVPEGGSGSPGEGQFQWANSETTKIFFTDVEKLTSDSTAEAGKPDLYEYDLEKPQGQRLTDLTATAGGPANVLGVAGASEDGSYVYFAAEANLTGSQHNSQGDTAIGEAHGTGTLSGVTKFTGNLMRPGRTGSDYRMVGAHQAVFDRHLSRGEVDQPAMDEVRTDPPRPFFRQHQRFVSIPGRPPMPDPIETPARSLRSSSISVSPASSSAWPAASMA